jgi:hypothetical protein
LIVQDPGLVTAGEDFNHACGDDPPGRTTAGLVLVGQTPGGANFTIVRTFDPCELGRVFPDGSRGIGPCSSDPSGIRMFLCSRQGYMRLTETALVLDPPELGLDDLSFLGIAEELQSLGFPTGNPIITSVCSKGSTEDNRFNTHATVVRFDAEVSFSAVEPSVSSTRMDVQPTFDSFCGAEPPFFCRGGSNDDGACDIDSCAAVSPDCPEGVCVRGSFLDPDEACDDGDLNGSPWSTCSSACELVLSDPICEENLAAATRDTDADGIRDLSDVCPGTPSGAAVDRDGCSQAQFCGMVDVTTSSGKQICRHSDWRNDEPLLNPGMGSADCDVDRGLDANDKSDDRCVRVAP